MATGKAKKKDKLRHAEYYDFQAIQDKLYADSNKGKVFKHLVEIIALPENIRLAYRNIKKNHGSTTPGTDGKTITELSALSDEQLICAVQRKLNWYVPQSVRRVEIPKGNDPMKKRPLGIPTIMDRLIQQCVLQVMEPICEAKFHDHSYGFRPNRNQQHAIAQVHKNMQRSNLHYVVDIDVKGFFDNVNHGKLLKQLWTMGIQDKKLLIAIIKKPNNNQKRRTNGSSPEEKHKRGLSEWHPGGGPNCGFSSSAGWLSSWTTFSQLD